MAPRLAATTLLLLLSAAVVVAVDVEYVQFATPDIDQGTSRFRMAIVKIKFDGPTELGPSELDDRVVPLGNLSLANDARTEFPVGVMTLMGSSRLVCDGGAKVFDSVPAMFGSGSGGEGGGPASGPGRRLSDISHTPSNPDHGAVDAHGTVRHRAAATSHVLALERMGTHNAYGRVVLRDHDATGKVKSVLAARKHRPRRHKKHKKHHASGTRRRLNVEPPAPQPVPAFYMDTFLERPMTWFTMPQPVIDSAPAERRIVSGTVLDGPRTIAIALVAAENATIIDSDPQDPSPFRPEVTMCWAVAAALDAALGAAGLSSSTYAFDGDYHLDLARVDISTPAAPAFTGEDSAFHFADLSHHTLNPSTGQLCITTIGMVGEAVVPVLRMASDDLHIVAPLHASYRATLGDPEDGAQVPWSLDTLLYFGMRLVDPSVEEEAMGPGAVLFDVFPESVEGAVAADMELYPAFDYVYTRATHGGTVPAVGVRVTDAVATTAGEKRHCVSMTPDDASNTGFPFVDGAPVAAIIYKSGDPDTLGLWTVSDLPMNPSQTMWATLGTSSNRNGVLCATFDSAGADIAIGLFPALRVYQPHAVDGFVTAIQGITPVGGYTGPPRTLVERIKGLEPHYTTFTALGNNDLWELPEHQFNVRSRNAQDSAVYGLTVTTFQPLAEDTAFPATVCTSERSLGFGVPASLDTLVWTVYNAGTGTSVPFAITDWTYLNGTTNEPLSPTLKPKDRPQDAIRSACAVMPFHPGVPLRDPLNPTNTSDPTTTPHFALAYIKAPSQTRTGSTEDLIPATPPVLPDIVELQEVRDIGPRHPYTLLHPYTFYGQDNVIGQVISQAVVFQPAMEGVFGVGGDRVPLCFPADPTITVLDNVWDRFDIAVGLHKNLIEVWRNETRQDSSPGRRLDSAPFGGLVFASPEIGVDLNDYRFIPMATTHMYFNNESSLCTTDTSALGAADFLLHVYNAATVVAAVGRVNLINKPTEASWVGLTDASKMDLEAQVLANEDDDPVDSYYGGDDDDDDGSYGDDDIRTDGGDGGGGGGDGGGDDMGGAPIAYVIPVVPTESPMSTMFGSMGGLDVSDHTIHADTYYMGLILTMFDSHNGEIRNVIDETDLAHCKVQFQPSATPMGRSLRDAVTKVPVDPTVLHDMAPRPTGCDIDAYAAARATVNDRIEDMPRARDWKDMDSNTWGITAASVTDTVLECHNTFWSMFQESTGTGTKYDKQCKERPYTQTQGQGSAWVRNPDWWEDPCCNIAAQAEQCCVARPTVYDRSVRTQATNASSALLAMCGADQHGTALAILADAEARFTRDGFGAGSACTAKLDVVVNENMWSTLTEFRVECDKLIFDQSCSKHGDCYSGKCDTSSRSCQLAWDDPSARALALARCFADSNTKMDPVIRLSMKEFVNLTDFSDTPTFIAKLAAAFMGDEDCVGRTGHDHSGRHVRVTKGECDKSNGAQKCQEKWVWQDGNQTGCLAAKSCNWNRWDDTLTQESCEDETLPDHFCGECNTPNNCWARYRPIMCFIHGYWDQSACETAGYAWSSQHHQCVDPAGGASREACLPQDKCPWSWPRQAPLDPEVNYCDPDDMYKNSAAAADGGGSPNEEACVWPHIPSDGCGGQCVRTDVATATECHSSSTTPRWSNYFGHCTVDLATQAECTGTGWEPSYIANYMSMPAGEGASGTRANYYNDACSALFGPLARWDVSTTRCRHLLTPLRNDPINCEAPPDGTIAANVGHTLRNFGFGDCWAWGNPRSDEAGCTANQPLNGTYYWRNIGTESVPSYQCRYESNAYIALCNTLSGFAWDVSLGMCVTPPIAEVWDHTQGLQHLDVGVFEDYDGARTCAIDRGSASATAACGAQVAAAYSLSSELGFVYGSFKTSLGCTVVLTSSQAGGDLEDACTLPGTTWDNYRSKCSLVNDFNPTTTCLEAKYEYLLAGEFDGSDIASIEMDAYDRDDAECIVVFNNNQDLANSCTSTVVPNNAPFVLAFNANKHMCVLLPTGYGDRHGCAAHARMRDGTGTLTPNGCVVDMGNQLSAGGEYTFRQRCEDLPGAYWNTFLQLCIFNMDNSALQNEIDACNRKQDARFTGWWWATAEDGSTSPEFAEHNGTCARNNVWNKEGCESTPGYGTTVSWVEPRWFDKGDLNTEETCTTPSCDYWDMQGKRLTGDACLDPSIGYCTQQCKKCMSSVVWEWGRCFSAVGAVSLSECEQLGGEMATAVSGVCVMDRDQETCLTDASLGGSGSVAWEWHSCTELAFNATECASVDNPDPAITVPGWAQELQCYPSRHAWCESQEACEQPHNGECADWEFVRWESANQENNWQPTLGGCLADYVPSEQGIECDWNAGWSWGRRGCVRRDVFTASACTAYGTANPDTAVRWVDKADTASECAAHGTACNIPGIHALVHQPDAEECRSCRGTPENYYEWYGAQWQSPPLRQFDWMERAWSPENRWVPAMNWSRIDEVVQYGVIKKMQSAIKESARCSHNLVMDYVHNLMCLCGGEGGATGAGTSCAAGALLGVPNTTVVANADSGVVHGVPLASTTVYKEVASTTDLPTVTVYVPPSTLVDSSAELDIAAVPTYQLATADTIATGQATAGLDEGAPSRRRLEGEETPALPYGITGTPVVDAGLDIRGQLLTDVVQLSVGGGITGPIDVCITVAAGVDLDAWPQPVGPTMPDIFMAEIGALNEAILFQPLVTREANKLCATVQPTGTRPVAVVALTNATDASAPAPIAHLGRVRPLFTYVDLALPLPFQFRTDSELYQLTIKLHALPLTDPPVVWSWGISSIAGTNNALAYADTEYDITMLERDPEATPADPELPTQIQDADSVQFVSLAGPLPPGDWRYSVEWAVADFVQGAMDPHPVATVTPIAVSTPAAGGRVDLPFTFSWTADTNRISQTLELYRGQGGDVESTPFATLGVDPSLNSVDFVDSPNEFASLNPLVTGAYAGIEDGPITIVLRELDANLDSRTVPTALEVAFVPQDGMVYNAVPTSDPDAVRIAVLDLPLYIMLPTAPRDGLVEANRAEVWITRKGANNVITIPSPPLDLPFIVIPSAAPTEEEFLAANPLLSSVAWPTSLPLFVPGYTHSVVTYWYSTQSNHVISGWVILYDNLVSGEPQFAVADPAHAVPVPAVDPVVTPGGTTGLPVHIKWDATAATGLTAVNIEIVSDDETANLQLIGPDALLATEFILYATLEDTTAANPALSPGGNFFNAPLATGDALTFNIDFVQLQWPTAGPYTTLGLYYVGNVLSAAEVAAAASRVEVTPLVFVESASPADGATLNFPANYSWSVDATRATLSVEVFTRVGTTRATEPMATFLDAAPVVTTFVVFPSADTAAAFAAANPELEGTYPTGGFPDGEYTLKVSEVDANAEVRMLLRDFTLDKSLGIATVSMAAYQTGMWPLRVTVNLPASATNPVRLTVQRTEAPTSTWVATLDRTLFIDGTPRVTTLSHPDLPLLDDAVLSNARTAAGPEYGGFTATLSYASEETPQSPSADITIVAQPSSGSGAGSTNTTDGGSGSGSNSTAAPAATDDKSFLDKILDQPLWVILLVGGGAAALIGTIIIVFACRRTHATYGQPATNGVARTRAAELTSLTGAMDVADDDGTTGVTNLMAWRVPSRSTTAVARNTARTSMSRRRGGSKGRTASFVTSTNAERATLLV